MLGCLHLDSGWDGKDNPNAAAMPLMLMVGTAICMIVLFTLLPGVARKLLAAVVGAPDAADCLKPIETA